VSQLWGTLAQTDRFPEWWPWLRRFDSDGLVPGAVADCVVRAPLPYTLSFRVHVVDVVPEQIVAVRVTGDLDGPARLELASRGDGSTARLTWRVEVRAPLLRVGATVSRPLMEWGHQWVVDTGVRQFRRRALE
jgi:hypothetical protein